MPLTFKSTTLHFKGGTRAAILLLDANGDPDVGATWQVLPLRQEHNSTLTADTITIQDEFQNSYNATGATTGEITFDVMDFDADWRNWANANRDKVYHMVVQLDDADRGDGNQGYLVIANAKVSLDDSSTGTSNTYPLTFTKENNPTNKTVAFTNIVTDCGAGFWVNVDETALAANSVLIPAGKYQQYDDVASA